MQHFHGEHCMALPAPLTRKNSRQQELPGENRHCFAQFLPQVQALTTEIRSFS